MINEYALDPELIFEAARDPRTYKAFITSFGVGSPRFISTFPKQRAHKWESYIRAFTPTDLGEVANARAEELIRYLKENRIHRTGFSFDGADWLQNVLTEDQRLAFDVIFTNQKIVKGNVLSLEQTYDIGSIWDHKTQVTPQRILEAFCAAIGGLLRCSKHIVIVDPYAYKKNGITSIVGFINAAHTQRVVEPKLTIQIYFDGTKTNAASAAYLFGEIKGQLTEEINSNVHLHVSALVERENSEKLHNRYVMSELGGIQFGVGTDVGEAFHTDDLVLLNKDIYQKRWEQYVDNSSFDIVDEKSG